MVLGRCYFLGRNGILITFSSILYRLNQSKRDYKPKLCCPPYLSLLKKNLKGKYLPSSPGVKRTLYPLKSPKTHLNFALSTQLCPVTKASEVTTGE